VSKISFAEFSGKETERSNRLDGTFEVSTAW
jgi:hypothetical protein